MRSPSRAIFRAAIYGLWTSLVLPVQFVAVPLRLRLANHLPKLYHRVCCRLLGIQVTVLGQPCGDHPVLFVANHASYLDIAVLGSQIAGSFVAKAEIARWPFFGMLARLQRTVFIDRRGARAADHRDDIGARLAAGDDLILFPEGTSSDGNRVLPFKTALFSVAEQRVAGRPIVIQPVSVAYTHLDGLPMGREWRPHVAWYGDMPMGHHIRNLVSLGKIRVEVAFHPAFSINDLPTQDGGTPSGLRKLMAERSHAAIVAGHGEALFATGRHGPVASIKPAAAPQAAAPHRVRAPSPIAAETAGGGATPS